MFVVQRKVGERLVIGGGIEITVVESGRRGVRLAVTAPRGTMIARGEVHDAIAEANANALRTSRTAIPLAPNTEAIMAISEEAL
jgi:carbon storage regulator